jgi:vacuolar-type H+-ATPase subunit I/STV1
MSSPAYLGNADVARELEQIGAEIEETAEEYYTAISAWLEAYERLKAHQTIGQKRAKIETKMKLVELNTDDITRDIDELVNAIYSWTP